MYFGLFSDVSQRCLVSFSLAFINRLSEKFLVFNVKIHFLNKKQQVCWSAFGVFLIPGHVRGPVFNLGVVWRLFVGIRFFFFKIYQCFHITRIFLRHRTSMYVVQQVVAFRTSRVRVLVEATTCNDATSA